MKPALLTSLTMLGLTGCAGSRSQAVDVAPLAQAIVMLGGAVILAAIISTFGGILLAVYLKSKQRK